MADEFYDPDRVDGEFDDHHDDDGENVSIPRVSVASPGIWPLCNALSLPRAPRSTRL